MMMSYNSSSVPLSKDDGEILASLDPDSLIRLLLLGDAAKDPNEDVLEFDFAGEGVSGGDAVSEGVRV